jgi:nitrogen fixation protein NifU and related proteins
MSDLEELYRELIRDHSKKPRNFGKIAGPHREVEGYNPLCGDRFTVYVDVEGDIVKDIRFEGTGCAISTASASLMTQSVKGKTRAEAEALFHKFHQFVAAEENEPGGEADLGKLSVFAGVRKFPVRVKCATLAWHTFHAALESSDQKTVSTE